MLDGWVAASPPKFVSLEEIMKAAKGMQNMALAHEIAVDKNFKIDKLEPEDDTLHKKVKEIVHKAFWDILSNELSQDPPIYTQALRLLKEIKDVCYNYSSIFIILQVIQVLNNFFHFHNRPLMNSYFHTMPE